MQNIPNTNNYSLTCRDKDRDKKTSNYLLKL